MQQLKTTKKTHSKALIIRYSLSTIAAAPLCCAHITARLFLRAFVHEKSRIGRR